MDHVRQEVLVTADLGAGIDHISPEPVLDEVGELMFVEGSTQTPLEDLGRVGSSARAEVCATRAHVAYAAPPTLAVTALVLHLATRPQFSPDDP